MKNITLAVLLLFNIQLFAQKLICVQSDSTAQFFTDFGSAVTAANSGDIIYLPGGATFGINIISKSLTIIGAGYSMDSSSATGITVISSDMSITGTDIEVNLEGIYFNGSVSLGRFSSGKVNIFRCSLNHINGWNSAILSGTIIESEIRGSGGSNSLYLCLKSYGLQEFNGLVANCIFYKTIGRLNGATFKNCIFLDTSAALYLQISNSNFINNIFLTPCFDQKLTSSCSGGYNNYFRNNIFTGSACFENTYLLSNNQFNISRDSIFINWPGSTYSPGNRYVINPSGPAAGAGQNGTDIGITGGDFPWKPGGVPHNPHINFINIGGQTNADGTLPVEIRVRAQDR